MLQLIEDHLYLSWNNPNQCIQFGFQYQAVEGYPIDQETGETDFEAEPKDMNMFVIGLLFFNIEIYW